MFNNCSRVLLALDTWDRMLNKLRCRIWLGEMPSSTPAELADARRAAMVLSAVQGHDMALVSFLTDASLRGDLNVKEP